MNAMASAEYRKLALDSSNDMIDHDTDRTLGRYPKAAVHIRNAGFGRLRMGEMMFADGDFTQAAADWLSAAACFYSATDLERMRATFDRVLELEQEGKIPPERRDIHAAIKERKEEIGALEGKQSQFQQGRQSPVDSEHVASQESRN